MLKKVSLLILGIAFFSLTQSSVSAAVLTEAELRDLRTQLSRVNTPAGLATFVDGLTSKCSDNAVKMREFIADGSPNLDSKRSAISGASSDASVKTALTNFITALWPVDPKDSDPVVSYGRNWGAVATTKSVSSSLSSSSKPATTGNKSMVRR